MNLPSNRIRELLPVGPRNDGQDVPPPPPIDQSRYDTYARIFKLQAISLAIALNYIAMCLAMGITNTSDAITKFSILMVRYATLFIIFAIVMLKAFVHAGLTAKHRNGRELRRNLIKLLMVTIITISGLLLARNDYAGYDTNFDRVILKRMMERYGEDLVAMKTIDALQIQLKCCGIDSYKDWSVNSKKKSDYNDLSFSRYDYKDYSFNRYDYKDWSFKSYKKYDGSSCIAEDYFGSWRYKTPVSCAKESSLYLERKIKNTNPHNKIKNLMVSEMDVPEGRPEDLLHYRGCADEIEKYRSAEWAYIAYYGLMIATCGILGLMSAAHLYVNPN